MRAATVRTKQAETAGRSAGLLLIPLLAFLAVCVFDPADRLLGLKVQVFLVCWFVAVLQVVATGGTVRVHRGLLIYVLLFLIVPSASIVWYFFSSGETPFAGFQLLKGYLLVTLSILLYMRGLNLMPYLAGMLVILAIAILGLFALLSFKPELTTPMYVVGMSTGIFILDSRDYGGGLVLQQTYFVTSPMLAIAIAHYFDAAKNATTKSSRIGFGLLLALCAAGMFVAGTRNNMAVAVLLPAALLVATSRRVVEAGLFAALVLACGWLVFSEAILQLLDPTETANSMKIMLLQDYARLLDDPLTMFLGRGLGAYDYWEVRAAYYFVSELTYLEIIRNFGLFGGLIMLGLLLFPVAYTFVLSRNYAEQHLVIAYAFYLLMCASNPNLFSSMGILILAIVTANVFMNEAPSPFRQPKGALVNV